MSATTPERHVTRQEPKELPLRLQVHAYIRDHPAAHILELAEAFHLTHPTVMYHLDLLADEGYVVSTIWGKRRAHFDSAAHFTAWEREVLALLALDEARSILENVAASPRTFSREIAQRLGVSETTVKRYVPELLRLGLVAEVESGFRRRFAVPQTLARRVEPLCAKLPRDSTARSRLMSIVPSTD
ncbi:MAG: winged helix-turn-helix transcriptional regulator [Thermoplasmatota archaeon]